MNFRFAAFFTVFSLLFSAWALAEEGSFSADMISQSSAGTFQGKFYSSGQKSRIEMPQATMIVRLDLNVTYMLMPEQRMYMEQAIDPQMIAQTSRRMPGEIERTSLGKESVDGEPAEKFLVRYSEPSTGEQSIHQWIGGKGFPVKTASVSGDWSVEYRNISTDPQPESLFEPPADYQHFAMPNIADMMQRAAN